jgi:hypothetical protein
MAPRDGAAQETALRSSVRKGCSSGGGLLQCLDARDKGTYLIAAVVQSAPGGLQNGASRAARTRRAYPTVRSRVGPEPVGEPGSCPFPLRRDTLCLCQRNYQWWRGAPVLSPAFARGVGHGLGPKDRSIGEPDTDDPESGVASRSSLLHEGG